MAAKARVPLSEPLEFCQKLPKVELHAHLNGSLRDETVKELAIQKLGSDAFDAGQYRIDSRKTLADCFALFGLIHQVVNDVSAVSRVTREVIEDFSKDNVCFLELRTTPRECKGSGMTKLSYVQGCVDAISACNNDPAVRTITKLLLSIDRRMSTNEAFEVVRLAAEFAKKKSRNGKLGIMESVVVGVDLSGDPSEGDVKTLLPALELARGLGLKISVHIAEIENHGETRRLLAFRPDRLAHAVCLSPSLRLSMENAEHKPPLEICITSNLKSGSVATVTDHQFGSFFETAYPVVLCTDDKGAFSTTLSQEYAMAVEAFGLSEEQLLDLASASISYIFANEKEVTSSLEQRFTGFRRRCGFE